MCAPTKFARAVVINRSIVPHNFPLASPRQDPGRVAIVLAGIARCPVTLSMVSGVGDGTQAETKLTKLDFELEKAKKFKS